MSLEMEEEVEESPHRGKECGEGRVRVMRLLASKVEGEPKPRNVGGWKRQEKLLLQDLQEGAQFCQHLVLAQWDLCQTSEIRW